ncbi:hypothetical protein C8J57DRAFT_1574928 [Mycena rebaudengoi]|nr:hypothetical protein C8J57DRAFT_1574928 [Mycena rebaudengoi]
MLSELDLSLGVLEIGVLLSSTLWGATTLQLYVYVTARHKDPLWTKALWAIASHGNTSPSGESLRPRKAIIWKVANTILPDSEQDGKLVKRPARQEGEVNTDDI